MNRVTVRGTRRPLPDKSEHYVVSYLRTNCGDKRCATAITRSAPGSSPRVRGTRPSFDRGPKCNRVIPAGAENTGTFETRSHTESVHPRRGGEHRGEVDGAEALPNRRKTALRDGSSQIGRRTSNRAGIRWTSSTTTRPLLPRNMASGVWASASRVAATSRSKTLVDPGHAAASCRASVVLPTCRAPSRATTGASRRPSETAASKRGRSTSCCISTLIHWIYDNKKSASWIVSTSGDMQNASDPA